MPETPTADERAVARLIRSRLKDLNISQAEMARRGGMAPAHFGQYLSGKTPRVPDEETIERLTKALGVHRDTLILAIVHDAGLTVSETDLDPRVHRLVVAAGALDDDKLDTVVRLVEQMAPPPPKGRAKR